MKSINFCTALILCSLFVFSCTNLRIEKRRYNKGLHIHSSSQSKTAASSSETALEKDRAENQSTPGSSKTVRFFIKNVNSPKSSSTALTDGLHSKTVSVVQSDNLNPKKVVTTPRERQNSMNRTDRFKSVESVNASKKASKQVSKVNTVKPTHTLGSAILSVFGWLFLVLGTLILIWAILFFGWAGIYAVIIALALLFLGMIFLIFGTMIKENNQKSEAKTTNTN